MLNAEQFSLLKSELKYSGIDAITSALDLEVLGSDNLTVLISHLRSSERKYSGAIEKSYKRLAFFEGKSGKDFEALAAGFERPVVRMAVSKEALHRAIPVDVQSQLRKEGTTTFNLCGWCEHSASGTHYASVPVETLCDLSVGKLSNIPESEWVPADTPCKFPGFTAAQCAQEARSWREMIEFTKSERDKVRSLIKALQELVKNQPNRPLLPSLRHWTHFEAGARLAAFVGQVKNRTTNAEWVFGTVIKGYRYQDGLVSYATDTPFHTGDYLGGAGGWGGDSRAEFLKLDEYEALREAANSHDEHARGFFEVFMRAALHTSGLDMQQYRRSLQSGDVA